MSQEGALGIKSNPSVPIQFITNAGTAVPAANTLNVLGGVGVTTSGAGNTLTIAFTEHPIMTINGDTGSITGTTVTVYADTVAQHCGSSVKFSNAGTISTLNVSDANENTIIGVSSGNSTLSASFNTIIGAASAAALTSGNSNHIVGHNSVNALTTGTFNAGIGNFILDGLITGSYNCVLGYSAGSNYTNAESSNILVSNKGVASENNTIRIGTQGAGNQQQNICYVAGITGATPTSANTPQVVLCDNTGNLTVISSSTAGYLLTSNGAATPSFQVPATSVITIDGDTGSITGTVVTIYAANASTNCGSSVLFANAGTTSTLNVTDANVNTCLGLGSGNTAMTGEQNACFGSASGSALTSGSFNSFCGYGTGTVLTTGTQNTAFGTNTLTELTGGSSYNCAIGVSCFTKLLTGQYNVGLGGYTSGGLGVGQSYTTSESSNILIQSAGVTGESNVIRVGTQGNGTGEQDACYIAGIAGATISSGSPTFGAVIIDTSDGQLASATTGISTSGYVLTSNGTATAPTWQAVSGGIVTIDGNSGSVTGSTVTVKVAADNGTASFSGAGSVLSLASTDANTNTCWGFFSLLHNTSGQYNVGLGSSSVQDNTTGNNNVGVGYATLNLNQAGTDNVAIGYAALGSLNGGSQNISIGSTSAQLAQTGSNNVCIGYDAGGAYNGAESDNICIGAYVGGVIGESSQLRIGNGQTGCYIAGIHGATTSDAGTTTAVLIDQHGNLGTIASSIRYKESVKDLSSTSEFLYQLRPVSFHYIKDVNKTEQYGLIAEEVQKVFPGMVIMKDEKPESIHYEYLPVLLLNELQKLKKEIEQLKAAKCNGF